jgi:solute:Na+ symporter, SSS family
MLRHAQPATLPHPPEVQDLNLRYELMGLFLATYGSLSRQNSSAYNSASASPHETRIGGLPGLWREQAKPWGLSR